MIEQVSKRSARLMTGFQIVSSSYVLFIAKCRRESQVFSIGIDAYDVQIGMFNRGLSGNNVHNTHC